MAKRENCGKKLSRNSKFCDSCGTMVSVKDEAIEKEDATKAKLSKKKIIIGIGGIIVIAALVFVFFNMNKAGYKEEDYNLFNKNVVPVQENGKYGYINKEGDYIISPQFDNAYGFSSVGLALVYSFNEYGYINEQGNCEINPQYEDAYSFTPNGLAGLKETDIGALSIRKVNM
jgi:uncharacterized membrane protein YvbJ